MVEQEWTTAEAFSKYAIWAVILTFLTSMMGEFLIWTQVVSYWTQDVGFNLEKATNIYALIGLVGIFSMPIMGKIADKVVQATGIETKGRKIMLMSGPAIGVLACVLLLASPRADIFAYVSCFIFAIYWAIVPGGVVGYTGAIYGRKTLGKIWGLATMIVMGIGPFMGSYIGEPAQGHLGALHLFHLLRPGLFPLLHPSGDHAASQGRIYQTPNQRTGKTRKVGLDMNKLCKVREVMPPVILQISSMLLLVIASGFRKRSRTGDTPADDNSVEHTARHAGACPVKHWSSCVH